MSTVTLCLEDRRHEGASPEFDLPSEDRVGPTARVEAQEVGVAAKSIRGGVSGWAESSKAAFSGWDSVPRLEDEGEVLLPEEDTGRVPADRLHVDVNHHQVGSLLIPVVLQQLQVDHGLWGC